MNVSFYIKRPQDSSALIYCTVTFEHKRISFSTGQRTSPSCWMAKRYRVKGANKVNDKLQDIENICHEVYGGLSNGGAVDSALLKSHILRRLNGRRTKDGYLLSYYREWVERRNAIMKPNRQFALSYRKICEYADETTRFSDVTYDWISGYIEYLNAKNYSLNYIGCLLKNLKAVMNDANKKGLHDNMDFKKFGKMEEEADSVYLTTKEIEAIEKLTGLTQRESVARDLFLVGYYTAMRYSDYSRLSLMDISNGILRKCTMKTGEIVSIPANPKLVKILTRYGGSSPLMDESELNSNIKSVCKQADILDIIPHTITLGGKKTTQYYGKYELVSSHTARRSGATNMYLSGIKPEAIMMITGHKSYSTFKRYIRITKEENAMMLSSSSFFRD